MRSAACLLLLGLFVGGCAYANPGTTFKFDPLRHEAYFYDTKDNNVSLAKLSYNADTGEFVVEGLEIINNASDVRVANVEQMMAFVEQQKAANEGILVAFQGLSDLAGRLGISLADALGQIARIVEALPDVKTGLTVNERGGQFDFETDGGGDADVTEPGRDPGAVRAPGPGRLGDEGGGLAGPPAEEAPAAEVTVPFDPALADGTD